MKTNRSIRWSVVAAALLAIVAAGCSSKSDTSTSGTAGGTGMTGSVDVSGSSTVLPISQLVAENFSNDNADAQVSVDGPGTGDGFVLFCEGKTDINDASRQIEPEEAKACKQAGVNYVAMEIGLDGITVMTNPANSQITSGTKGDLYALFGGQPEGFGPWRAGNASPRKVGGKGIFPHE